MVYSYEELVDCHRPETHACHSRFLRGFKSCPYQRFDPSALCCFRLNRFKGNVVAQALQASHHMQHRALATQTIEMIAT